MTIEWRPIENFPMYKVSNTGLVESNNIRYKKIKSRLLKQGINKKHGYAIVCLSNGDGGVSAYVHRLVALSFIPNPENKRSINHKNGVRTDNRVENLEWVTPSENMLHAIKNKFFEKKVGSKSARFLLDEKRVALIFKDKDIHKEVAKKYSVSETCIADIKTGRTWNHVTGLPLQRKLKSHQQ